ncbi:MAG: hypothetical protein LBB05_03045 [Puniceicoccales bacterium]|nr:hypothetical protein [Puniceicoccales bacterium]
MEILEKLAKGSFFNPITFGMFGGKDLIIGSTFLALGLWSNNVYSSMCAGDGASGAQRKVSREKALRKAISRDSTCFLETLNGFEVRNQDGIEKIMELVQSDVDLIRRDEKGRTILFKVVRPSTLVRLIDLHRIDIDARDDEGNTVLVDNVITLVQCMPDTHGFGREKIRTLIDSGANPFLENVNGETALSILEDFRREEEQLPLDERHVNPGDPSTDIDTIIQMLRDAEIAWAAAHPRWMVARLKWMAAHPECTVE